MAVANKPLRFIACGDIHCGFERQNGRKQPVHDLKSWAALVEFAKDFKPDAWVFGGDQLDCAPVSHWNGAKKKSIEGLRLLEEFQTFDKEYLTTADRLLPRDGTKIFHFGNHERFIDDFTETNPGVEGLVEIESNLNLVKRGWKIVELGKSSNLGKLHFLHGDKLGGGDNYTKKAVTECERSVRIFHHHTYQATTKVSALDVKDRKTAVGIPCLCLKNPGYAREKPNRWLSGFNYGYIHEDGTYNDYVPIITNGRMTVEGKTYKG